MESDKIYEDSFNELVRISKMTATDTMTIKLNKLDTMTKQVILMAINNAISERKSAITAKLTGAK